MKKAVYVLIISLMLAMIAGCGSSDSTGGKGSKNGLGESDIVGTSWMYKITTDNITVKAYTEFKSGNIADYTLIVSGDDYESCVISDESYTVEKTDTGLKVRLVLQAIDGIEPVDEYYYFEGDSSGITSREFVSAGKKYELGKTDSALIKSVVDKVGKDSVFDMRDNKGENGGKSDKDSSGGKSFTNAYGTPTTKCNIAGCNNYIASSGDTNCCEKHSNRCLNCNDYIDSDAMYCMKCITESATRAK